ncbi:MAG: Hsp70 family protein [Pseudomonadota bacterium]
MSMNTLAVDFGTSNSAAATAEGNEVRRLAIESHAETLPTAVFFPVDGGQMQIGTRASHALTGGEAGRYMRALKTVLGLPVFHEKHLLGGRRRTLAEVVTAFLAEVKHRAEAAKGTTFGRVLSGRPVHFHSTDPAKDVQAEADLRACYEAAGFEQVAFLAEPEAAAFAVHGIGGAQGLGLVVDIGGGTSDFSVFSVDAGSPRILASHGARLGGTDFDRLVSLSHVMPALGLGGRLRAEFGTQLLPVPRAPYVDLSTWAKIPFLYTAETRRRVARMVRVAERPETIRRLAAAIELELGHDIAFAVERGKISANGGEEDATKATEVRLDFIEPGLSAPVSSASLDAALTDQRHALRQAAAETLTLADISPGQVGRVVLVGGSSLMRLVTQEMLTLCPGAGILHSEAFTAVVDGLARASMKHRAD